MYEQSIVVLRSHKIGLPEIHPRGSKGKPKEIHLCGGPELTTQNRALPTRQGQRLGPLKGTQKASLLIPLKRHPRLWLIAWMYNMDPMAFGAILAVGLPYFHKQRLTLSKKTRHFFRWLVPSLHHILVLLPHLLLRLHKRPTGPFCERSQLAVVWTIWGFKGWLEHVETATLIVVFFAGLKANQSRPFALLFVKMGWLVCFWFPFEKQKPYQTHGPPVTVSTRIPAIVLVEANGRQQQPPQWDQQKQPRDL